VAAPTKEQMVAWATGPKHDVEAAMPQEKCCPPEICAMRDRRPANGQAKSTVNPFKGMK
jgi:hypothetical protein